MQPSKMDCLILQTEDYTSIVLYFKSIDRIL